MDHEFLKAVSTLVESYQLLDDTERQAQIAALRAKLETAAIPKEQLQKLQGLLRLDETALYSLMVYLERMSDVRVTDAEILGHLPDTAHPKSSPLPVTALLMNIRSAFNVGSIWRTMEAFHGQEILCCGYTPTPESGKLATTALGTEAHVAWRAVLDFREALAAQRARGYRLIALETTPGAISIYDAELPMPCTIIVGNERHGLSQAVLAEVDMAVKIPLSGRKNSLNVAVAFGIALSEIQRRHRF